MSVEDTAIKYLLDYGLTGVVILIFYKLISNDIKELKQSIDKLRDTIEELIKVIYKSNTRG
jgi:tetrahydromethanopterin S-methyltransferase subunit B